MSACTALANDTIPVSQKLTPTDFSWMSEIRLDHPRLFLNKETFPQVKARALNEEKAYFKTIQEEVDQYPNNPVLEVDESWLLKDEEGSYKLKRPKGFTSQIITCVGGRESAQAAFVYLVTGNENYLEKAKKMLKLSIQAYEWSWEHQLPVEWEINHYVSSLMAYDWLYNDLTVEERTEIITPLISIIKELQPGGKASFHHATGGIGDGFYGARALLWHVGIATYKNGIHDQAAEENLKEGYRLNIGMLNYRDEVSSGDGLLSAATLGYSLGAYPFASYNFFHTFHAFTGIDVSNQWEHMANFPQWVYWNWINGAERPLEFGIGDSPHINNALTTGYLYSHLSQNIHFYEKSNPSCAGISRKLINRLPDTSKRHVFYFPITPFLLTHAGEVSDDTGDELSEKKARYFKSFGLAFMRSGTDADDTYCLFRAGSHYGNHQHYDENSFIIYHKGFLALDSGTRGMTMSYHLPYYYGQTVAHNSILIHMPNEKMAPHWGPETIIGPYEGTTPYCHGGQSSFTKGKCLAFETNDAFTYVAGDATQCYSPEKCTQAIRQFVFLYPDIFIVFDRVSSTKPSYRKEWLLHSESEPDIQGNIFSVTQGDGVLFCKSLYPNGAEIKKVGRPGKEFWASGKNWELHQMEQERYKNQETLFGKWRIEVSPKTAAKDDFFLHVIQVGDKGKLEQMLDSTLIDDGKNIGVHIEYKEKPVKIIFKKNGTVGGTVFADDTERKAITL